MSKTNRHLDPFTKPTNGFKEEPNPEVELAFVLQNVQPGDQRKPSVLVERCASELHQFIEAVLETHRGETIPEDEIQEVLQQTFTTAISEVDRFWGKDSVRNWLFSLALHQIRKMESRKILPRLFHRKKPQTGQHGIHSTNSVNNENAEYSQAYLNLSSNGRKLLTLRYFHQLSAADIAQILSTNPQKISKELVKIRHSLLVANQSHPQPAEITHKQFHLQINLTHDGLFGVDSDSRVALKMHLEISPDCQAYADQLDELEEIFSNLCRQYWPLPEFDPKERVSLIYETWQFTIAEERMRLITRPYLLGEDTCEPMISFAGTPSTSDTSEHRLYF